MFLLLKYSINLISYLYRAILRLLPSRKISKILLSLYLFIESIIFLISYKRSFPEIELNNFIKLISMINTFSLFLFKDSKMAPIFPFLIIVFFKYLLQL